MNIYCRIKEGIEIDNSNQIHLNHKKKDYHFSFHKVWNGIETGTKILQDTITDVDLKPHYYVFYGYTGSGKTYTSTQIMRELLEINSDKPIMFQALQMYDKYIFDLLTNQQVTYYKTETLVVKHLSTIKISNIDKLFKKLNKNRKITATNHNHCSSRSHAVYYITIANKQYIIVDMAGQESKVTYKNPVKNQESKNINMSILSFKNCVLQLKENAKYIPFRRSLLTMLLKQMFYSDCSISMICTISLKQSIYYQLDSMRYITDIKQVTMRQTLEHPLPVIKEKSLLENYTDYLTEVEWCACQERKLHRTIKNKGVSNEILGKINNYLLRKSNEISKFKLYFKKYRQVYHE